MLILALDTTARSGSCAVVLDGVILQESVGDGSVPQASRLPRDPMAILTAAGATLSDVDVFAVAAGPGSFTGLRVGIAFMQGLALAGGRPLVGVSTLDALARLGDPQTQARVATWVDAWRGEVYAALYDDGRLVEEPSIEAPAVVLARLGDRPTLFIGDGVPAFAALVRADRGHGATIAAPTSPPLAGTVARIAAEIVLAGQSPRPHAIAPIYVRRSYAERGPDVPRR